MSLGKLLTTGKSLVGLGDNGRYQLRTGEMPKFESSKNPFAKAEAQARLPKLSAAEIAAANMKKTQPLPVLAEVRDVPKVQPLLHEEVQAAAEVKKEAVRPSSAKAAEGREEARPVAVVESWVKKLNPMVWLQNRKPAEPKAVVPRFGGGKRPVQGELSLDNIKVMRNDLSETDVEVVPAKARPAKVAQVAPVAMQASAAAMAIPELPPATNAWEFLGERLLGKE